MSTAMTATLPDPIYQAAFYSGVPAKRLFAWLVDVALILTITLLLGVFTFTLAWFFFPIFYLTVAFLYRWWSMSARSATLGMRLMAVEIRNGRGMRLDSGEAMLHTLAYMVCAGFFLPQLLSIVLMLTGARGQGLHDLLLGTAAINRPG